jgi:hypothetical protein
MAKQNATVLLEQFRGSAWSSQLSAGLLSSHGQNAADLTAKDWSDPNVRIRVSTRIFFF